MADEVKEKHSGTGASSAYRWMTCPGSVSLIKKAPKQAQNKYAAEGQAAHQLAEKCLIEGEEDVSLFEGDNIIIRDEEFDKEFEFEVDEDMISAVRIYVDEIRKCTSAGWAVWIEEKIDLSRLHPGLYGTADAIAYDVIGKRIKVFDYKHGKGIPVEAVNNKQELYYVLGAVEAIYKWHVEIGSKDSIDDPLLFGWHQFNEIELVIVQPRARHKEGPIRRWIVPKDVLDKFQDELLAAVHATEVPGAPLVAGKHCKFCSALATCPAQEQFIADQTALDFKPIDKKAAPVLPPAESLSIERLASVLQFADHISSWLKAVEAHAFALMSRGESVPGFKLVKKKANRRWINPDEARQMLSLYMTDAEMLTVPELKSPAQVEKSLKKAEKELIKPLIEVPDTGLTLAEESDPREAISGGSVMSEFQKIN